jgi:hypothetical protein
VTNIASGTTDHTRMVLEAGAVPHLITLATSQNLDASEQVCAALFKQRYCNFDAGSFLRVGECAARFWRGSTDARRIKTDSLRGLRKIKFKGHSTLLVSTACLFFTN